MNGLLIEYSYAGDEAPWSETIGTFLKAVAADPRLAGRFRYHVFVRDDGKSRVHVPSRDDAATLAHLQAQPFFKASSEAVQRIAGGTLKTTPLKFGA
jgi:hypothetical protein